jgi:hypothetical protein
MLLQAFALLAEAVPAAGIGDLAPMISTIGSLGISAWHVYYTTAVTIPKLMEDFKNERKEVAERHAKEMEAERADHGREVQSLLVEMKETRNQFSEWMRGK